MSDIKNPRVLWFKFALFLVVGRLASTIALLLFPPSPPDFKLPKQLQGPSDRPRFEIESTSRDSCIAARDVSTSINHILALPAPWQGAEGGEG
jgi:hypothetical protein